VSTTRSRTEKTLWLLAALAIILLGAIAFSYFSLVSYSKTLGPAGATVEINIPSGSAGIHIARLLASEGVIDDARKFDWYARYLLGKPQSFRSGYYSFERPISPEQVAAMLILGKEKEFRFTIPEGSTQMDIARAIEASGLKAKSEVVSALSSTALRKACEVPESIYFSNVDEDVKGGLEGYLFPDTYHFRYSTSAQQILEVMNARLKEVLAPDVLAKMRERGLDVHRLLTMASIVEKETGAENERSMIAAVIFNRLKKKMPLQMDPTVSYGFPNFVGPITKSDLRSMHLYNTYTHSGLPPGPICSPGKEAIFAVLNPADVKYLYFVSRNDGSHIFCESLGCHERAVRKWQKGQG
jgi:UPF0755 protein